MAHAVTAVHCPCPRTCVKSTQLQVMEMGDKVWSPVTAAGTLQTRHCPHCDCKRACHTGGWGHWHTGLEPSPLGAVWPRADAGLPGKAPCCWPRQVLWWALRRGGEGSAALLAFQNLRLQRPPAAGRPLFVPSSVVGLG